MSKKLISIFLVLIMTVSFFAVCGISTSAATDTLSISAGGKNYTAKVGDTVTYTITFKYAQARISTAQVELPVDFSLLKGYTSTELDQNATECFPGFTTDYYARYDKANTYGLKGYVVNFASFSGYDFSSDKIVMKLPFTVTSGGTAELKAALRFVSDKDGNDIIDSKYTVKDTSFKYTESLEISKASDGVTISGKAESYLSAADTITFVAVANGDTTEYKTTVTGNTVDYSLKVPAGKTYTLSVSKNNHVTREYTVNVGNTNAAQDVKICPIGDANLDGKVKINDVNAMYKNVLGTKLLTDPYAIKCADVKVDNKLKINDVNAVYKHVLGTKKLFE